MMCCNHVHPSGYLGASQLPNTVTDLEGDTISINHRGSVVEIAIAGYGVMPFCNEEIGRLMALLNNNRRSV